MRVRHYEVHFSVFSSIINSGFKRAGATAVRKTASIDLLVLNGVMVERMEVWLMEELESLSLCKELKKLFCYLRNFTSSFKSGVRPIRQ